MTRHARLAALLWALASLPAGAQTVGLVLSGGGATGLAHIGVLKALEENGIPIDYITGSSMGALIGGMYAAGYSPAQMDSLFRSELYLLMSEGRIEDRFVYHFAQPVPDASIFEVKLNTDTALTTSLPTSLRDPVLLDLEQMFGFSGASAVAGNDFDSLFIPFRCVAADITAHKLKVFREGDLAQAIRASMSYPFYFKPISVDGHLMMDGGLFNNFPSDLLYYEFLPDLILGSNVTANNPPPTEDDLMSQLRAMVQQETDYSLRCQDDVIIEPTTTVGTFDFRDPGRAIADGYRAAMMRMPDILARIGRRTTPAELAARRARFHAAKPKLVFSNVRVVGLSERSTRFAEGVLNGRDTVLLPDRFRERYFRLYADANIAQLHPRAHFNDSTGRYEVEVSAKREKKLAFRVGGLLSSRPVNTGMIGLRYNFLDRTSNQLDATAYFGKFYSGGQLRLRSDISGRRPFFIEPALAAYRWDWFTNFASFFEDTRPSYILQREAWGGVNLGAGLAHKGLSVFDIKYVQARDDYYQNDLFTPADTADRTDFRYVTTGIMLERNSLNRKQHPNAGEWLRGEVRYVSGEESTTPGSTSDARKQTFEREHEWLVMKATLDKYFIPKGKVRFGVLAEGLWSTQGAFQNYTATIIRMPAFQPTPETRTYFIDAHRAPQYLAGGLRSIIAVARNKFDLRLEGYVFQPYKAVVRGEDNSAQEGTVASDRSYIASGSLIYQSPVGPIWFNTTYLSGKDKPWSVSLSFGYVIFAPEAIP
ncbi:MAG: patatin-like phospholipase family protein [Flavobacteriales bacterium]|nr:patatin-like phospholipase family protein [Flavobacteriales bacterium]